MDATSRTAEGEMSMAEMYIKYQGDVPVAYAYGDPWVAQALFMDDIGYKTPEEAIEAWNRRSQTIIQEY